jgi:tetratricopeptide (TPR) repeat protein
LSIDAQLIEIEDRRELVDQQVVTLKQQLEKAASASSKKSPELTRTQAILSSLETERASLDASIVQLTVLLPASFERGSSRSSSRPASTASSPQPTKRRGSKASSSSASVSPLKTRDDSDPAAAAAAAPGAAAGAAAPGAAGDVQDLSIGELESRIESNEKLNDAVLQQIDSVLENLGKKVRETEKVRMRAVMAALTAENMKCDLDLRNCRRVLKQKLERQAVLTASEDDLKSSDKKTKKITFADDQPHKRDSGSSKGVVQVHRKKSTSALGKKSDGAKLDVQMMESKEEKKNAKSAPQQRGGASTGTVLMQQDASGQLSPAMVAEIERLRDAIKETPNDATLHHTLGFSLVRVANDTEGGIAAFKAALAIQPKLVAARVDLGLAYYKLEQWQAAVDEYRQALDVEPDNCNALINLGNAQRQLGQTRDAVKQYERVLEMQPKNATAALNLGNAHQTLGDFDAANRMYERVLEIAPSNVYARTKLAEQALEQGKFDAAREHAEKAMARDAKNARALAVLGAVLEHEGKLDESLAQFKAAHAADASNATVCASIGAVLGQQGNASEAVVFLKKAVATAPHDAKLLNQLGQWQLKSGAADDARATFADAVKCGVAELDAAKKHGGSDASLAVKSMRALLANIHSNYGHVLDESDDCVGAQAQYEASLALVNSAATLNKLGACFASQKLMAEAVEQFMAALALAPDEPTVHYNLAAAHAAQGALTEALRHAQTAVLHDENFEAAKTMVAVLLEHQAKSKKK